MDSTSYLDESKPLERPTPEACQLGSNSGSGTHVIDLGGKTKLPQLGLAYAAGWHHCESETGSGGDGSIISWLPPRCGREIPNFCILQIKVVRFKPSLAAAPFVPPI